MIKNATKLKNPDTLRQISIPRIKQDMKDVYYLSDDLVIMSLDAMHNITQQRPITIDSYAALVMMTGEATLSIDLKEYRIGPNKLVFFNPGSVIGTNQSTDDATAYIIAFSSDFVHDIEIDISTSLPVFMRIGKAPVFPVTQRDVDEIRQIFQLIKTMIRSDKTCHRQEIIRSLFTTAFYVIVELNDRDRSIPSKHGRCEVIFEEFMTLIQQHFKTERGVKFYAKKLGISPKYLSCVVKSVSGKTAAVWIDETVIREAKTMLKYSGLSIQEIADDLHFSTQSFFGKYFKQHTGTSPSRYKHKG